MFMITICTFCCPWHPLEDWQVGKTGAMYEAILRGFFCTAGKVGAIVAGVVLGQISDQNKFIVSAITGLVGFIITFIFVPGAPSQHVLPSLAATWVWMQHVLHFDTWQYYSESVMRDFRTQALTDSAQLQVVSAVHVLLKPVYSCTKPLVFRVPKHC